MERERIKEIVYRAIKDHFCFDEDFDGLIKDRQDGGEGMHIYSDLSFDSIDIIELMLYIEYEIGNKFKFDEDAFDSDMSIAEIIDYIYEHINK